MPQPARQNLYCAALEAEQLRSDHRTGEKINSLKGFGLRHFLGYETSLDRVTILIGVNRRDQPPK